MIGFGDALRVIEEIIRIQRGSLPKPPTTAMKLIAALFEHNIDNRAAVVSKLGGEAVVLNLELLDDLNRRLVVNVRRCALALFRGAGQCAVYTNLSSRIALSIRHKVGPRRVRIRCTLAGSFRNSSR